MQYTDKELLVVAYEVWKSRDSSVCKELSRQEFETRYPDVSIYEADSQGAVFLSDGTILLDSEWSGEAYHTITANGSMETYVPLYLQTEEDSYVTVGYISNPYGLKEHYITIADIQEPAYTEPVQTSSKRKLTL